MIRDHPIDNGYSQITAEEYIIFRQQPALARFLRLAPRLERGVGCITVLIFFLQGVNALLAQIEKTVFIPIVVAVTSALAGILEFHDLTHRLAAVNGAIEALENTRVWWESLSLVEQRLPETKEYLVEIVENAIIAEHDRARVAFRARALQKTQSDTDEEDEKKDETEKK